MISKLLVVFIITHLEKLLMVEVPGVLHQVEFLLMTDHLFQDFQHIKILLITFML